MYRIPTPEELKQYRWKTRLTQTKLAKKAKVDQSLIARIERGDIDPRASTLRKIVDALNDEVSKRI